jgi:TolA-binding protein
VLWVFLGACACACPVAFYKFSTGRAFKICWYIVMFAQLGTGRTAYVHMANQSQQSNSSYAQLSDLKARIESGRSRLTMLETQLKPVDEEITGLNSRIKSLATDLKTLAEQNKSGHHIDEYNSKRTTYLSLVDRQNYLVGYIANDVKTRNALWQQDNILVDEYNALLKQ